jgi:hypothetical protein
VPRYFFHVTDGTGQTDDGGRVLADLAAAKCEAVKYAGDLICGASERFWDEAEWHMTVADETGLTLFTLILAGYDAPSTLAARA